MIIWNWTSMDDWPARDKERALMAALDEMRERLTQVVLYVQKLENGPLAVSSDRVVRELRAIFEKPIAGA